MIFTSLGLILVALGFLIAGIAKSSVALLMVSLMLTLASGIVLVLVAGAARRLVEASGVAGGGAQAPPPSADGIMYVPVPAASGAVGGAGGNGAGAPPVIGYDDMTADQVAKLIRSGALTADQLDAIRAYEEARQGRRTVLDAVTRAAR